MVYPMIFRVDGGCRNNGWSDAIASAACCRFYDANGTSSRYRCRTKDLPRYPTPTSQRAELTAIMMALRWVLREYDQLDGDPRMEVMIYSDSKYAVECMNNWRYRWFRNGWVNSSGKPVANRDLIEKASDLDDQVTEIGRVSYVWASRDDNHVADRLCNEALYDQEYGYTYPGR